MLTIKNRYNNDILHTDTDPKGHYTCQVIDFNKLILISVNVYGYNSYLENSQLFNDIEYRLKHWQTKFPNSHIIIGGDFNVTFDPSIDRWPPTRNNNRNSFFKTFMERFDLVDIWRVKFPDAITFTWSNKENTRLSRLDFWIVSKNLNEQDVTIEITLCPFSDHKAIHISIHLFSLC